MRPPPAPVAERPVVTIDGLDGSGKSMFADRLAAALASAGLTPVVVHVDDYRRAVDWSRRDRPEAEIYYDEYYDLAGLERDLRVPTGARSEVAVVEGVFPLRVPTAAAGLVIYLEVGEAEARRRILERDLKKGRSREEVEHRISARYFPGQERYRAAFHPRERADVIVDNVAPESPRARRRDLGRASPEALRAALDRLLPPL
jgi:uridine kinase